MTHAPDPPLPGQHDDEPAIDLRSIRTFVRQWLRDPTKTASVVPSGRQLAQRMVAQLPKPCTRVVEIGAGTGVFTRELLESGIEPAKLLVVEINPELAEFLRERFPGVAIACADARGLDGLAAQHWSLGEREVDAVVSGLGLLSMSSELRCEILRAGFKALRDGGRFIQFTYGPASPVRRDERNALGISVRRAAFAPRNLPPATVYVYQRFRSKEVVSVRRRTADSK